MSHLETEIASQPHCWEEAATLAASSADVRAALPAPGERVAFVGCGTSLFMAQSAAALREQSGGGESDAFAASEFPVARAYDRVVAICRSGTTTEIVRLLGKLSTPTTVITSARDLPVSAVADHTVDIGFADERSVVQTRFATTALALIRAHLGEDLAPVAAQARTALDEPLDPRYAERTQVTFLGTGWGAGLANEAALKVREAAQAWTESYPAMEFRHGPISVIDTRSLVWIFGTPPDGLLDDLAVTGGLVVTSAEDPLVQLVGAQRLALARAVALGLDPDQPRGLTRSIVLDSA